MTPEDRKGPAKPRETPGLSSTYGWALKLFASATSVVAGLIAFGFFSEAALYEMAGLPRLSADPIYLAEAGARGLVSSLAAVRGEGVAVLVVLLALAYAGSSARDQPRVNQLLRSPGLLVGAQVLVLCAVLIHVFTLVAVAGLGTARGRDKVERKVHAEIGALRDRADWTPTLELERSEGLRMAPTPLARGVRAAGELLRRGLPGGEDERELEAGQPSLGFPIRPTEGLRRQARDFYGWLVVGAIVLPGLVVLLRRWRAWAADRVPLLLLKDTLRLRLPAWLARRYSGSDPPLNPGVRVDSLDGGRRRQRWAALYHASSAVVEPILVVLSLAAVALLPSAHGVLAEESIGLQPVLVRLSAGTRGLCGPGSPSVGNEIERVGLAGQEAGVNQVRSQNAGEDERTGADGAELENPPCTCTSAALGELDRKIVAFRAAWQSATLLRISELEEYERAREDYEKATDDLMAQALRLRCAGAFRRLWILFPEAGELEAQPQVAEYFVNRFSEAIKRDGFGYYGHVLAPPRGDDRDRITLFTRLGRNRWVLRELRRAKTAEILLLPNEKARIVDEAIAAVRSSPIPNRLGALDLSGSSDLGQVFGDGQVMFKRRPVGPAKPRRSGGRGGRKRSAVGWEREGGSSVSGWPCRDVEGGRRRG